MEPDGRMVSQTMEDFLAEHVDLATNTVAGYRSVSRSVICHPVVGLAGVDVTTLSGASLNAWRRGLAAHGVSKANRRLAFAVLRSALSWDVEVGRLDRNPALGLTTRRTKASAAERAGDTVRLPTWDDLHRSVVSIPDHAQRLMYLLFAFSGPRAAELFALEPSSVLSATAEIDLLHVWVKPKGLPWRTEPLKGGVPRRAPVPHGLFQNLLDYRDIWEPPEGDRIHVLFRPPTANRHGPGLWTNELWRTTVILPSNQASQTNYRTKDLRAFAASMLVDIGATQVEAQQLLGHSSPETTQRHYIRAQKAQAHDPVRSALRFDSALTPRRRMDAAWDAFVERFGDPLGSPTARERCIG
jgi:integrase